MIRSLLRRRTTLSVVVLIGIISILHGIFNVREYIHTYKRVTSRMEIPALHNSRQALQLNPPIRETKKTGRELAEHVWQTCGKNKDIPNKPKSPKVDIFSRYATSNDKVQVCGIWKIGTTFIKRLFMLKYQKKYNGLHNPYEIPFDVLYSQPGPSKIDTHSADGRVMFVRNPYNRVYSGFIDKLLAPNPVYWGFISVPAIKLFRRNATALSLSCGHDLLFKEYVEYIVHVLGPSTGRSQRPKADGHFDVMSTLCKPCEVHYNFIGKMENFKEDSLFLIKQLEMNKTEELIREKGQDLSADDAIRDTAYQPFDPIFKPKLDKCITKRMALEKAWMKLKARGLIGRKGFDIDDTQIDTLTYASFLKLAFDARALSTDEERKLVKNEIFDELFGTIRLEKLEQLGKVYAQDFKLFDYEERPDRLFSNR